LKNGTFELDLQKNFKKIFEKKWIDTV